MADLYADFNVAFLGCLGEVGGGYQRFGAVDNDAFCMQAGSAFVPHFQRAWIVEELRKNLAGPVLCLELVLKAKDDLRRERCVRSVARHVQTEANAQAWVVVHTFGQPCKYLLTVVNSVAHQHYL